MSRYAWLVCEETKQMIWLGKIVDNQANGQAYFHIGPSENQSISQNQPLVKAILKFLAQNIGKTFRVWPEEMMDAQIDEHFIDIGGDSEGDMPIEKYIKDFPG